jgi:peptidoglycan/xylan/chitin deacetylase (PgdA/CDA1 family)
MVQLEQSLTTILGYYSTYMRPPYLETNAQVLSTLASLGYHVIQIDIDTEDWQNTTPELIGNAVTNYQNGINNGGTISLSHDPLVNTANTLVQAMIDYVNQKGLKCEFNLQYLT